MSQNKASTLLEICYGQGRGSEDAHTIVFALPGLSVRRQFLPEDRKTLDDCLCALILRKFIGPICGPLL